MIKKVVFNDLKVLCNVICTCTLLLLSIPGFICNAGAEETDVATEPQPIEFDAEGSEAYEYQLEERSDPFSPFLVGKSAKIASKRDEIIDEGETPTGMQLFEPGQLKLVAIITSETFKMAMVEDVTGQGYIIKEGIPIGKRGTVTEIKEEQVLITEIAKTRSGRELVNTVIMRLNKEGE